MIRLQSPRLGGHSRQSPANRKYRHKKRNWGFPQVNPRTLFALDPLRDKRWRELTNAHPASSVFHKPEWLSALQSSYGYEPVVYTTCEPSADLTSGIVFCKVKSWLTGRRLVSLPFSDHCDPLVENSAEHDDLLLRVRASVDGGEWDYCEVRPVRFAPGAATMLGQSNRYFWHSIDLRPSLENIFKTLHSSVQRKIRRAERESLTYAEGNSELLLQQFYKLVIVTRRRQNLPPQPIKWFRSLIANLGANLKIRVASKDSMPIASILTLNHSPTVTYKYGCSDARMHALGGMALCFWSTIQQAKDAGYETLDLGRSDTTNSGLIAFKEHWGGVRSDLSYWRYPNRPRSNQSWVKQVIVEQIVKAAPDRALTAVGKSVIPTHWMSECRCFNGIDQWGPRKNYPRGSNSLTP